MVEGNSIVVVKGISGSGKSTRGHYLISFLETLGAKFEPFEYTNIKGEKNVIGQYCVDFNMVFVGKFYYEGGVRRWQGYDAMTGRLGKAEGLSKFLKDMCDMGIDVFIDGAGVTATHRLRPIELCATSGFLNVLYVRYDYREDQREEYRNRIIYRSGEPPKGDQMFRKHNNFLHDMQKAIEEASDVNACGANVEVADQPYDSPVWDLGVRILRFFEFDEDLVNLFIKYSNESDYIKQNSYENFQRNKV